MSSACQGTLGESASRHGGEVIGVTPTVENIPMEGWGEGRQMVAVPSWSPALILERIQATEETEASIATVPTGSLSGGAVSWLPVPVWSSWVCYSPGLHPEDLLALLLGKAGRAGIHACAGACPAKPVRSLGR